MTDWGDGQYELTAETLQRSAHQLVERAELTGGERLLDLGCGTGNVALRAAALGARVTGVDPARRLLKVTTDAARAAELEIQLKEGRAEAIPAGDAEFDRVLSHFALIFADDAEAAMREIRRVLAPGGRLLFTAWLAEGPVHEALSTFGRAMAASATTPPAPQFAWRDPEAVRELVARHFEAVEITRECADFTAPSANAFVTRFLEEHPLGLACAARLDEAETLAATIAEATSALADASSSATELLVESPYIVVAASRT